MILIHDGYMIDPKSGREGNYDILIDGDKIVKIAEKIEPRGKVTRINAEGLLVAPGLVDVHVHFRDPGFTAKEDINTGAAAAAKGGVTTVVLMANTKPAVDSEETLHYILDKGAKTGIHVTTCANVTMGMQGKQLTDMKKLAVAGAVGFTDDGVPLLDAELVRHAMEISAELDMPISFHEEDPKYIENNGVKKVAILENWLHAISNLRNCCAHHSRVWNRRFMVSVTLPYNTLYLFMDRTTIGQIRTNKLFAVLSCIAYILDIISPGSDFKKHIKELLKSDCHLLELKDMGFPKYWQSLPVWREK